MSVRVVRTRNGEDVICDIREITSPEDDSGKILGYQLIKPYVVWISEGMTAEDDDGNIHKMSNPQITMEMYAPLAKEQTIILRYDEIISAYETHEQVVEKYTQLVEASNGQDTTTEERESE
tara:strand:- start:452 stop:814 length:363 start_codon:yes stop_codon:yes gene_type:complete